MKNKLVALLLLLALLIPCAVLSSSAELLSLGVSSFASDAILIKSGKAGQTLHFSQEDFKTALQVKKLDKITVLSLPDKESGTLRLANAAVKEGETVSASLLDLLKFYPKNNTVTETSFLFSAGSACGGSELTCLIRYGEGENTPPSIKSNGNALSVQTQKGISFFGTLQAKDAENDALYFRVNAYPKNGLLSLNAATGEYRYTPLGNFCGKDSFTVCVRDEYGNFSESIKVGVEVKKRKSTLVYEDVKGTDAELSAVALTDCGIFLGRLSGDSLFFDPDTPVSKADFVVMAMKAAGVSPMEGAEESCFDDNESIPISVRPYIATAQDLGYIHGTFTGTGLYFYPDSTVTKAEAAVILCNMMGLSDAEKVSLPYEDSVPVWAVSSVGALLKSGALSAAETFGASSPLTRKDAAKMLYAVMNP
ncbi:MAG: cadherin-like domain-containing protein [Clostridia bacterium]|nr:cadherin-like domain-containing protein [Clostridia bacterium]